MFFFNDTATTEIYTLSLHDALPICRDGAHEQVVPVAGRDDDADGRHGVTDRRTSGAPSRPTGMPRPAATTASADVTRSEEHTSELQSRQYLVCRLLLEKKKYTPRSL